MDKNIIYQLLYLSWISVLFRLKMRYHWKYLRETSEEYVKYKSFKEFNYSIDMNKPNEFWFSIVTLFTLIIPSIARNKNKESPIDLRNVKIIYFILFFIYLTIGGTILYTASPSM